MTEEEIGKKIEFIIEQQTFCRRYPGAARSAGR